MHRVKATENVFACAFTILEESFFPMSEWETAGALTRYEWKPLLCALFSGTGSEKYSSYWNLLSDPLAGSKLGR